MSALTVDSALLYPPVLGVPSDSDRPPVVSREIPMGRSAESAAAAASAALQPTEGLLKHAIKTTLDAGIAAVSDLLQDPSKKDQVFDQLHADAVKMNQQVDHYLSNAKKKAKKKTRTEGFNPAHFVHELRTPMQSLLFSLSYEGRSGTDLRNLRKLYDSLDKLADEIQDGDLLIHLSPFDPQRLFDTVEIQMAPYAQRHGIALSFHIAPGIQDNLIGDKLRLGQMLRNLISNAIKHTARGKKVEVTMDIDPATQSVVFIIKDEGRGISEEDQPKLFQEYSQVEVSCWRRLLCCFPQVASTGLGLDFCKKVALKMNSGRELEVIGVRSVVNEGSSFWFLIPYIREPKQPIPPTPSPIAVPTVREPNLRYLLVDDVTTNLDTLQRMITLRGNGARLVLAKSRDEAIHEYNAALPTDPFPIVILDLKMPSGEEGVEAALAIQQAAKTARIALPLLIITSGEDADDVRAILAKYPLEGDIVVLSKPVAIRPLIHAINDNLRA